MKPVCAFRIQENTHASACCGAAVITVDGNKRKRLPAMVALLHSRWGGVGGGGSKGTAGQLTRIVDCRAQPAVGRMEAVVFYVGGKCESPA